MSKELELLRSKLNAVDEQLIVLLAERKVISREIGYLKKKEGIAIEQADVWNSMCKKRNAIADHYGADKDLVKDLFELIHQKSINEQQHG